MKRELLVAVIVVMGVVLVSDSWATTPGYWRLEEGTAGGQATSVADSSGLGYHGVTMGGPKYSTDVFGAVVPYSGSSNALSLDFDGIDDEVTFTSKFPFHDAGDATIEFWVNIRAGGHRAVLWTRADDADYNRFNFYAHEGHFGFDYRTPTGVRHVIVDHVAGSMVWIGYNRWAHIAISRTANIYRLYVDGTLQRTVADASPDLPTAVGWQVAGRSGFFFGGKLDELRFSNRELSPSEFLNAPEPMCANGGPYVTDPSTPLLLHLDGDFLGADAETPLLVSNPTFEAGRFGQGAYFDGGDRLHYATAGNISLPSGAVEFWVKPRWSGNDGQGYIFFEAGGACFWCNRISIRKDGANNLRFMLWDGAAEYGLASNVGNWLPNEWHHVVTTWNGRTLGLYVDGQLRASTSNGGVPTALTPTIEVGSACGWGDDCCPGPGCQPAMAVIDELRISSVARCVVPPPGQIPTASAGPDQTVDESASVTLHGSGSDPLGRPMTYVWTRLAGPEVTLSDPTAAAPTFTAPLVPAGGATLTFQLIVTSPGGSSEPDVVNVTIRNVNHAPIAETTGDQTAPENTTVTLDGRPSYDLDNESLIFAWTQTAGSTVALSGTSVPMPSFAAPAVGSAGETLTFQLVVNDGIEDSAPATVNVHVTNVNQAPTANAGADFTSGENASVSLNGTGSDPDLDPLTCSWTQVGGSSVVLSDPTAPAPSFWAPFVAPGGETFTFRLVVNDGLLDSAPDDVTVHVLNTNDPPSCAVAVASPTSIWPPNHGMVPIGIRGVVDPQGDPITIVVTAVMQDEPIEGLGDGDTSPDAVIQGGAALIRAERSGSGDGRVYTVSFTATDDFGESCSGAVKVAVPQSMKKGVVPGDGGPLYVSTGP